jgi:hypothetical protein
MCSFYPLTYMTPYTTVRTDTGYILLYSLIMITLFASIAAGVVVGMVRDLENAGLEAEVIKAANAASSGLECASKWQSGGALSFDTNAPASVVTCHTGGYGNICEVTGNPIPSTGGLSGGDCTLTTIAGDPGDTDACIDQTYTMKYGPIGSSDGSCVALEIHVTPNLSESLVCDVNITSRGYSDCGPAPLAERAFWGTF